MKKYIFLMFIITLPVILMCVTWTVRQDGNGDFETIQEAIDDSTVVNSHELLVYYFFGDTPYGPIDLGDKQLNIIGFPDVFPFIIASSTDPAVDMGSSDYSILEGFNISGTSSQTGIYISGIDQIDITDCIIEDLSTGISISNSQYIDINNCEIKENSDGCTIADPSTSFSRVSMHITDLYDNTRAIKLNRCYDLSLTNCLLNSNDEGIYMTNFSNYTYITNCTIVDNEDGLIWGTGSDIEIKNSIVWDNDTNFSNTPYDIDVEYSCIEDTYTGSTIIDDDPLFCFDYPFGYHLIEGSPCIDTGDPNTTGGDVRIDMGCYETTTDIKECEGEHWNWVSYPRLYRTDNDSVDVVPLLENFLDWDFDLEMIYDMIFYQDPTLEYEVFNTNWTPDDYDVISSLGYKLDPKDNGVHYLPTVTNATRLSDDWELTYTLVEDDDCWMGYWLPYTQNIEDAFGEFFDDLVSVSAEDWYYEYSKDETPSSSTANKNMVYGKGYVVVFETDIEDFYWTDNTSRGNRNPGYTRPVPQYFTFNDLPNYEVIDVMDIPPNVIEIGVFEGDICVGAVVVQNEDEQILAYTDISNRSQVPITFEVITNNRGENLVVSDYRVLNKDTGKYENRSLISGQQKSSIVRFGDLVEHQNNTPALEHAILYGNYPNPFNPTTNISFSLPYEQKIELVVYNMKGQIVRKIANGQFISGEHSVTWNGKDQNGKIVGSGLYMYKLITKDQEISKKMLLLK